VIPIHDDNPTSRPSIVVPILILLNVVVFLTEPVFRHSPDPRLAAQQQVTYFACTAAIPYEVTHDRTLANSLAALPNGNARLIGRYQAGDLPEVGPGCPHKSIALSILMSMFLHGSILHIAGNMLFLWVFGNNIEDRLGRLKFVFFYLACGIVATLAQSFALPGSIGPLIGASGAIAGVLGAYLILFPRAMVTTLVFIFFIRIPAVVVLGLWFVMQLVQGVGAPAGAGGIAYYAHIGGFVAGILLLLIFRPRRGSPAPLFS
jgi:membrane associated rhomboid family serine protease